MGLVGGSHCPGDIGLGREWGTGRDSEVQEENDGRDGTTIRRCLQHVLWTEEPLCCMCREEDDSADTCVHGHWRSWGKERCSDRWIERHKEAAKRRKINTSKQTRVAALERVSIGKAREARGRQRAWQWEGSEKEETSIDVLQLRKPETQRDPSCHRLRRLHREIQIPIRPHITVLADSRSAWFERVGQRRWWKSEELSKKRERFAALVDNVLPPDACSRMKFNTTRRSKAGIGFRGGDGKRIAISLVCRGKHVAGGGPEETAFVSGQDGCGRELCVSRKQVFQESQTAGWCHSISRKAGNVFVTFVWTPPAGGRGCDQQALIQTFASQTKDRH